MGSLTSGWDARSPGAVPKGFEDYKEPFSHRSMKRSPLSSPFREEAAHPSSDLDKACSPPNLAPIHGASTMQRYLSRTSSGRGGSVPSSPREPSSPRASTPRATHKLTLKIGDGEEGMTAPLQAKEKWCSRVESASLNMRPDVGDQEAWRHGSFKMNDPCHTMHIPASPTTQQGSMAPFTPPAVIANQVADASAAPRPLVTVGRVAGTASHVPWEAVESLESAGL